MKDKYVLCLAEQRKEKEEQGKGRGKGKGERRQINKVLIVTELQGTF